MKDEVITVGSDVEWESGGSGSVRFKRGIVIGVVPAGASPEIPDGFLVRYQFGSARNHESYLVKVGDSKRLYWPLVRNLRSARQLRFA
jgi:hypothetical protein